MSSIETGKIICRDIGGSDPERMSPLNCAEYIKSALIKNVNVVVEMDPAVLKKEYPLLFAVARASMTVPRHYPCVVRLEYKSPDQSKVKEK